MYEGGVRGPCSIIWPGVVKAGSRSDEFVQSCDFYPTLLEMLAIKPQQDQLFDGVSVVPALRGKRIDRDAMFTYFPHAPAVPDWRPPAVSVHRDDWKLVRIFHGGEKGAHRWKLFNLRDDIGEENYLVSKHPQLVRELDALIDKFLADTAAVVPVLNPNFDPAKYRLEDEGVSRRKDSKTNRRKKQPRSKPVAGWTAGNHCNLKTDGKGLLITSTGNDPHLSHRLPQPVAAQPLTLHITMTSNAKGRGQVFWQEQGVKPAYFRDRSTTFEIHHDGESHNYSVPLSPNKPAVALRLDPGQGAGKIRLSKFWLTDADGKTVFEWRWKQ